MLYIAAIFPFPPDVLVHDGAKVFSILNSLEGANDKNVTILFTLCAAEFTPLYTYRYTVLNFCSTTRYYWHTAFKSATSNK